MKQSKKNAFTLIELIATLVIMAIIALLATPLVMTIIRSARISADKRSIDAYGRSIELAIAGYLLDTGTFPTSVGQLTIEYSGNEVICTTTQLNTDSSVYLAGCTVNGRSVENYTYGEDKTPPAPTYTAYQVGDEVTYNNINYYVIKNSIENESTVTLLKAEPLTADEIATYSAGTGATLFSNGRMEYHSSSNSYSTSYVKTTIDAWTSDYAPAAIESRLIQYDELENLGYERDYVDASRTTLGWIETEYTPTWVYIDSNWYWTMSPGIYESSIWIILNQGELNIVHCTGAGYGGGAVRPVIVLPKSALN